MSKETKKSTKKSTPKASKQSSTKVKSLEKKVNDLQQQLLDITNERDDLQVAAQESKDQSLRSLAELENVRRRKEQEKEEQLQRELEAAL